MPGSKKRWGYIVWIVAGGVIGVPEIVAAAGGRNLPFTTISAMTAHLERTHTWVELVVVALIVLALYSVVRVPPHGAPPAAGPARTPGGRLTLRTPSATLPAAAEAFDEDDAPALFVVAALLACAGVAAGTWAAVEWWHDASHYQPAYVLYGSLALLWLVVPSVLALVDAKDVPFPTLVHSVRDLEDWLRGRGVLGPALAFLVGYLIVAGLAILLLHLTLYPYPDITKILNP